MKKYEQLKFTGERALFQSRDMELTYCTFADGESPLKESNTLKLTDCLFQWKYPLWYCTDVEVNGGILYETARAGIWYTENLTMKNTTIQAPKTFRRCRNLTLKQVDMPNAAETLWNCKNVSLDHVTAAGDYFAMNSEDMEIDHFVLSGNYGFDGAKNLVIRNSKLLTKDAFWNCENVTVYNSFIGGQYLGWNSKNITFVDCIIESEQGMCYMENVHLKNCRLLNTDLAFEYSTVTAEVQGGIDSIKNPYGGRIQAEEIGQVIFDNPEMKAENTRIVVLEKQWKHAG